MVETDIPEGIHEVMGPDRNEGCGGRFRTCRGGKS